MIGFSPFPWEHIQDSKYELRIKPKISVLQQQQKSSRITYLINKDSNNFPLLKDPHQMLHPKQL
jgi:hypothetical protein